MYFLLSRTWPEIFPQTYWWSYVISFLIEAWFMWIAPARIKEKIAPIVGLIQLAGIVMLIVWLSQE